MPTVVDATAGLGRDAFLLRFGRGKGRDAGAIRRSACPAGGCPRESARGFSCASRGGGTDEPDPWRCPRLSTQIAGRNRDGRPHASTAPEFRAGEKEMRLLAGIVGADEDAHELMRVALASARDHVVLKVAADRSPFAKDPGAVISILRQDRSIRGILDRNESRMRPEQGDDRETPSPAPAT